jgi:GNAT superfamily N-acetyltransferase
MNINHELRAPRNSDEWLAYHAIRRKVLFENRRESGVYIENHPDEFKSGHHPLILVHSGVTIGVIRVDVSGRVAWFRTVAVREDLQRSGHGRVLLKLAETFAQEAGCNEARSNVAPDAVGFYERCGYSRNPFTFTEIGSAAMRKPLP